MYCRILQPAKKITLLISLSRKLYRLQKVFVEYVKYFVHTASVNKLRDCSLIVCSSDKIFAVDS